MGEWQYKKHIPVLTCDCSISNENGTENPLGFCEQAPRLLAKADSRVKLHGDIAVRPSDEGLERQVWRFWAQDQNQHAAPQPPCGRYGLAPVRARATRRRQESKIESTGASLLAEKLKVSKAIHRASSKTCGRRSAL